VGGQTGIFAASKKFADIRHHRHPVCGIGPPRLPVPSFSWSTPRRRKAACRPGTVPKTRPPKPATSPRWEHQGSDPHWPESSTRIQLMGRAGRYLEDVARRMIFRCPRRRPAAAGSGPHRRDGAPRRRRAVRCAPGLPCVAATCAAGAGSGRSPSSTLSIPPSCCLRPAHGRRDGQGALAGRAGWLGHRCAHPAVWCLAVRGRQPRCWPPYRALVRATRARSHGPAYWLWS